MPTSFGPADDAREVLIDARGVRLEGTLALPTGATGVVLFAHGSGSSRHSTRNRYVSQVLRNAGIGTLLFDLLTREEEAEDRDDGHLRFDIRLLADRLLGATEWLRNQPAAAGLAVGYFGASTGGGAALVAAAEAPEGVRAVVSRGGRPDLAGVALPRVRVPTLLIVGGDDTAVIAMNDDAARRMTAEVVLEIIPGATHLFEEPGTLQAAARLATAWFSRHLRPVTRPATTG